MCGNIYMTYHKKLSKKYILYSSVLYLSVFYNLFCVQNRLFAKMMLSQTSSIRPRTPGLPKGDVFLILLGRRQNVAPRGSILSSSARHCRDTLFQTRGAAVPCVRSGKPSTRFYKGSTGAFRLGIFECRSLGYKFVCGEI